MLQSAAIAELSASFSNTIVQPLAAVVANAQAALNWLSSDNLDISQANAALEGVVRDGMYAGNIAIRREGEVTCVRIELPRVISP